MSEGKCQTWDYKVIKVHTRRVNELEDALKEHGIQGWELVFMVEPEACEYHCVFRRPLA